MTSAGDKEAGREKPVGRKPQTLLWIVVGSMLRMKKEC
jgi:hypothetical protein